MTSAPPTTEAADLGSAFADLGFAYRRDGAQAFLKDSVAIVSAHQRVVQSGQQVSQSYQHQTRSQQQSTQSQRQRTQSSQQATQQAIRLAQAEARVARAVGDSTAELAALRRAQQAATADRVQYLRATEQVIKTEQRHKASASGSSGAAALPRTFAGFTKEGAFAAAGALGIATGVAEVTQQVIRLAEESAALARQADSIGTAYESATARAGFGEQR